MDLLKLSRKTELAQEDKKENKSRLQVSHNIRLTVYALLSLLTVQCTGLSCDEDIQKALSKANSRDDNALVKPPADDKETSADPRVVGYRNRQILINQLKISCRDGVLTIGENEMKIIRDLKTYDEPLSLETLLGLLPAEEVKANLKNPDREDMLFFSSDDELIDILRNVKIEPIDQSSWKGKILQIKEHEMMVIRELNGRGHILKDVIKKSMPDVKNVVIEINDATNKDLLLFEGVELKVAILRGKKLDSIESLECHPLETLFLQDTSVSDLAPVIDCPLYSVVLWNTPVKTMKPLIGNTPLRSVYIFPGTDIGLGEIVSLYNDPRITLEYYGE